MLGIDTRVARLNCGKNTQDGKAVRPRRQVLMGKRELALTKRSHTSRGGRENQTTVTQTQMSYHTPDPRKGSPN